MGTSRLSEGLWVGAANARVWGPRSLEVPWGLAPLVGLPELMAWGERSLLPSPASPLRACGSPGAQAMGGSRPGGALAQSPCMSTPWALGEDSPALRNSQDRNGEGRAGLVKTPSATTHRKGPQAEDPQGWGFIRPVALATERREEVSARRARQGSPGRSATWRVFAGPLWAAS